MGQEVENWRGPLIPAGSRPGEDRPPVMVAYGCGLDSTGMVLGLFERGLTADVHVFADTQGEKPDTYHFLFVMDDWMAAHGFPRHPNVWRRPEGYAEPEYELPEERALACIQVVRNTGRYGSLEKNCVDKAMLPSPAYGGRSCSDKYKIRPQHQFAKIWPPARRWWRLDRRGTRPRSVTSREEQGQLVIKFIGYNADERHRSTVESDDFYRNRYPLREWQWARADCEAICRRHALPPPAKSACFFCPSSRKPEVLQLGLLYPKLMDRALHMEDKALASGELGTTRGLGRKWAWRELLAGEEKGRQQHGSETGCLCHGEILEGSGVDADDQDELD